LDEGGVVNNETTSAPITDPYDFNRDGVVNGIDVDGSDQSIVRNNPASTPSALKLIAAPGGLRDSYAADYYDAAGRLTAEENVGANGGAVWSRPATPDPADATHLVTLLGYDPAGNQNSVTDPKGIQSLSVFDMLGQQVQTIADDSDPAGNPIQQTTDYAFDGDGHVLTMTAVMPSGTPSQTTQYIYGVTGTGGAVSSNDLLARIEYPDLSSGDPSSDPSNDVSYTYDNLGETASKTDQNGTTHSYSYDPLGRLTLDWVTSLGAGVDGSVMALGYSYNRQGLPFQQTSYYTNPAYDSGATVNQDQDQYNGFGQLTAEYQSVSGLVDASPSGTPELQYGYSSAMLGSRLTSMTYPNGRVIFYGYDGNALDNALGRVDNLADSDGTHLADYTYLGLSTIVGQAFGDGVTETTTLDQFGRIAEMKYADGANVTDDFVYGYDADGNVLSETNGVNSAFSQTFTYDSLNRLTSYVGGLTSQSWSLDAVGNQKSVTTDGVTTTNTQNSQNELTGVGSSTLSYDNNGNTTTDANGHTYIYDAWNRLISVTNSSNIVLASYTYDANGRRITETNPTIGSGQTTALYFTAAGQVIEERQAGSVAAQNVFGIDYVNSLLLRDAFSTTGAVTRLYNQHDLTFNITALADATGGVTQRMIYTPYGVQTVLDPTTWAVMTGAPNTVYGPQGGRCDLATGLVHFGTPGRDYDPATAVWIQQDPEGYVDGANTYQAELSNPIVYDDASGLSATTGLPGSGDRIGNQGGREESASRAPKMGPPQRADATVDG
jgi:RHS repeat-associated protein